MRRFKDKITIVITSLAIFIAVFHFFAYAAPVVPYTSDNWATFSRYNSGIVIFDGGHFQYEHPSRILPKVAQPISGLVAAYIIYPVTGDYLQAIISIVALVLALLVTMLYVFLYWFYATISKSRALSLCLALLVIILHFAMFQSKIDQPNAFMLWSATPNMVFWFTLPNILNSALVLWLWRNRLHGANLSLTKMGYLKSGLIICLLYLAMFSNLFPNGILLFYVGWELLCKIISVIRNRKKIPLIKELEGYWINIITIIFFITHCLIDVSGGRAVELRYEITSAPLIERLSESLTYFINLLTSVDIKVAILAIVAWVAYIVCLILQKRRYLAHLSPKMSRCLNQSMLISVLCAVSILAFNIVIATQAGAWYAGRIDCMYGFYFFLLLTITLSCLYVMLSVPKTRIVLPFILLIFGVQMTRASLPLSHSFHFEESNPIQRREIVRSWIEAVRYADKNGQTEVTIYAPYFAPPFDGVYDYSLFADTLFHHSIISRPMTIMLELIDE